jgi:tetratricopeptide (TPR) repeat protein
MRWLLLIALLGATAAPVVIEPTTAVAQTPRRQRVTRARTLFREGAAAYEAGDLNTALRKMKAAQNLFRRPEFAYNIARVLERMGEARHAISWFQVYLRHGRPSAEERADIDRRIAALETLRNRQAGQLMSAPPSDDELTTEARTFFQRGVAMYQRNHFEAAMQAFVAAQNFAPFPELYYNMALTAERLERYRDARDFYREYLRLRPRSPDRDRIERRRAELLEMARNR